MKFLNTCRSAVILGLAVLAAVFFVPSIAHAATGIVHASASHGLLHALGLGGGGALLGMAFFNANVDALMRSDLHDAYEDMAFGGQYAAIVGLFKKVEKDGDAVTVPVKFDYSAGQGATAATAYANATTAARVKFIVTPFKTYQEHLVDMSQAIFTKGSDNSVADLLEDEAKTAMDGCKFQLDAALGATGYGELGTISSNSGGGPYTLTLSQRSDVLHVTEGSTYVTKATPSSASLDTGSFTVTGINPSGLQITVTANGGWTPTNTHVFGLSGTMAASTSVVQWPGIPGWIPPASARPVSQSDSFFQVNRSQNEMKLAGSYLDGSGASATVGTLGILEGVNTLAHNIADVPGANPDLVLMTFANKGKVVAQLQTQGRYIENDTKGQDIDVFYKTVTINGPTGPMEIVGSSNWPSNLVAVLDKSSWYLGAPENEPFKPVGVDGLPFQNVPGTDQAVCAYRAACFVYCDAPGKNGMLTVKA